MKCETEEEDSGSRSLGNFDKVNDEELKSHVSFHRSSRNGDTKSYFYNGSTGRVHFTLVIQVLPFHCELSMENNFQRH